MAPVIAVTKADNEKRITSLLSFADEILSIFATPSGPRIDTSLTDRLEKQLRSFPNSLRDLSAYCYGILDSKGTELWNMCTRLRRKEDFQSQKNNAIVLLMVRIYAFLMLDSAQSGGKGTFANAVRVLKLSLKTAKNCFDLKQLDLALKVLERAAMYETELSKANGISPEDTEVCEKLCSEYFVIRTLLEWRQGRLEVAEHMYNKAVLSELSARQLDPNTAESLADLLFEMGKEMYDKSQFEMAVKWLERAYNIIGSQELDKLSVDASELRTSIIQCSVTGLLGIKQEDATEKARSLVYLLESEVGDKLIVLLLKLELLLASDEAFDHIAYATVLRRMVRTVVITDPNFKLIMHHIRKLNDSSPSVACQVLDEFLQKRILQEDKQDWVEALLVNRVWMTTNQQDGDDVLASVASILETVALNINTPISTSATHACQILIWRRIEASSGIGQYDAAEKWCQIALHRALKNTGELNRAKITRKLLICALARQDTANAREIFNNMPESSKDEPMTRFLMYKIAIRNGEVELASECLGKVYDVSSQDIKLLYACVMDALDVGDKDMAIHALQLVFEKYDNNVQSSVHLPALLRVTIRLTNSQLESKDRISDAEASQTADGLCKLFEAAAKHAQKQLSGNSANILFDKDELDWFSKNSYNLALRYSSIWDPGHVLRVIETCLQFIDLYPKGIAQQVADDLSLRRMFCNFLATVLLISLARAEDNIQNQLQNYLILRNHVTSFDGTLHERLDGLDNSPKEDLLKKLSILLAYDFEAACQLKAWDDLIDVVIKAAPCKNMKVFELMADCILSCQAPTQEVVVPTLKTIVNAAWELDNFDVAKLSRYMRCLFQYALPQNNPVAEDLLDQISSLAQAALSSEIPYPTEELEWVATTAFNRAVDFYCIGEDEQCRNWSGKAINIASFLDDNGDLQSLLQQKLLGLNWDTEK